MTFERKNFEKKEGHCDYCEKKLSIGKKKYVSRYKVDDLVICRACYTYFKRYGSLRRRNNGLTVKEASKIKNNYLRSISPEELLSFIKKK